MARARLYVTTGRHPLPPAQPVQKPWHCCWGFSFLTRAKARRRGGCAVSLGATWRMVNRGRQCMEDMVDHVRKLCAKKPPRSGAKFPMKNATRPQPTPPAWLRREPQCRRLKASIDRRLITGRRRLGNLVNAGVLGLGGTTIDAKGSRVLGARLRHRGPRRRPMRHKSRVDPVSSS